MPTMSQPPVAYLSLLLRLHEVSLLIRVLRLKSHINDLQFEGRSQLKCLGSWHC
jgi:hypothetical protein